MRCRRKVRFSERAQAEVSRQTSSWREGEKGREGDGTGVLHAPRAVTAMSAVGTLARHPSGVRPGSGAAAPPRGAHRARRWGATAAVRRRPRPAARPQPRHTTYTHPSSTHLQRFRPWHARDRLHDAAHDLGRLGLGRHREEGAQVGKQAAQGGGVVGRGEGVAEGGHRGFARFQVVRGRAVGQRDGAQGRSVARGGGRQAVGERGH